VKREISLRTSENKELQIDEILDKILELDSRRRDIQTRSDMMQAEMNRISKEIGTLLRDNRKAEAEATKENTYKLKEEN